jgi:hypothetical protein
MKMGAKDTGCCLETFAFALRFIAIIDDNDVFSFINIIINSSITNVQQQLQNSLTSNL